MSAKINMLAHLERSARTFQEENSAAARLVTTEILTEQVVSIATNVRGLRVEGTPSAPTWRALTAVPVHQGSWETQPQLVQVFPT